MDIKIIAEENISNVAEKELLDILTEVVLKKSDEEISKRAQVLRGVKQQTLEKKQLFVEWKKRLKKISSEYSREMQVKRVLSLIETLVQEGVLIGKKRARVREVLHKIYEYDFNTLRNLEEKLVIYLPSDRFSR